MCNESDPFLNYPFASELMTEAESDWVRTGTLGMDDSVLGRFQTETYLSSGEVLTMSYLANKRIQEGLYDD